MDFEYSKFLAVSIILGSLIGVVGACFMLGVNFTLNLVWNVWLSQLGNPTWLFIAVPIIGGVLVGICVKHFGTNKGIGVESVMEQAEAQGGLSSVQLPRVILNSFVGLITGASIGPESAIMVLGGYIGTVLGKRVK